ncbi:MAG TPA: hypothetical protein VKB76_03895, partial [Ktedonobacterales bacterium]|nr:hypothetical protein [Ktedonobacterales bacterium]
PVAHAMPPTPFDELPIAHVDLDDGATLHTEASMPPHRDDQHAPPDAHGPAKAPPISTGKAADEPRYTRQRTPTPPSDLTDMLKSLRDLFVRDRSIAAQSDARRCGICYLMFAPEDVTYREDDGCYVCAGCQKALGAQRMSMLRRQKK